MGKISLYILLTLIYLGLSKSVTPVKENRPLLKSEKVFDPFFQYAPISVILTDYFEQGFFLKSYFLRLRVIHAYFPVEEIIIQTSEEFYHKNTKNLGMAIYERKTLEDPGRTIPQPGGNIFLGDYTFGAWKLMDSGNRVWVFHRAFRHFPDSLGWGAFAPNQEFYQKIRIYESYNKSFYGPNNEFGTDGSVSSHYFKSSMETKDDNKKFFLTHLKSLFSMPKGKGVTHE